MEKLLNLTRNNIVQINDEKDYEKKVLHSDKPVVIAYDAPWCEGCDNVKEEIKKVIEEHEGKIQMAEVDISKASELAKQNDVKSLPTTQIAVDGKVTAQIEGVVDHEDVKRFVDKHLKTKEQFQQKELDEAREKYVKKLSDEIDVPLPLHETNFV